VDHTPDGSSGTGPRTAMPLGPPLQANRLAPDNRHDAPSPGRLYGSAMSDSPERRGAATVEFRNVTKRYDVRARKTPGAVNDLSLTVPAGKICVLVGPSGCGKTTSLKMVNRLIEPTSGQILIDGADVAKRNVTDLRRGIGYVIQQTGLFPHQTIGQNVATVPRLLGWSNARQRERADELLGLVGLDPARYHDRYPSQLSGGERQRVGVARALAADPPIMLMDEPFGAVDPIVRERLQNEFLRLQEDLAKTILFVTHDIDEAIKLGDLVAVMQAGGILAQFGPPDEILARPASEFVARFVGADRGLKRLSLSRVRDLALQRPVTATVGERCEEARRRILADPFPYLLLVDGENRPIGWVPGAEIPADGFLTEAMAVPMSPLLDRRTTLKDALSLLLDADVQAGIVVDRRGSILGLVTVEMIAEFMRDSAGDPRFNPVTMAADEGDTAPEELAKARPEEQPAEEAVR
jgi:osmoprotectant transport system ATP-binding protein